jgi:hypothetical protein
MDTIQQLLQQQHLAVPQQFVIGGESKVSIVFYFRMYLKCQLSFLLFIAWMDR